MNKLDELLSAAKAAYNAENFEEALRIFTIASDEYGNSEAELYLAEMYEDGTGCNIDLKKSFDYYNNAYGSNPDAVLGLARHYFNGYAVTPNVGYAIELLEDNILKPDKSENDSDQAVSFLHTDEDDGEDDDEPDIDWSEFDELYDDEPEITELVDGVKDLLAEMNRIIDSKPPIEHVKAGVEQYKAGNYRNALKCFSLAACRDSADAFLNLGIMLENGIGTDGPEYMNAVMYYEKGAELGSMDCADKAVEMYFTGKGIGINTIAAEKIYSDMADKGYIGAADRLNKLRRRIDAQCDKCINEALEAEDAGDYEKSRRLYEEAIKYQDARGALYLARIYIYGLHTPVDVKKAADYFKKAKQIGGYEENSVITNLENKIESERLYEQAWKVVYAYGKKRRPDDVSILRTFEQSANLGNVRAMAVLAQLYPYFIEQSNGAYIVDDEYGDVSKAVMWINKAHEAGVADENLEPFAQKISKALTTEFVWDMTRAGLKSDVPLISNVNYNLMRIYPIMEKFALKGYTDCALLLAAGHEQGRQGLGKNYKKALYWYEILLKCIPLTSDENRTKAERVKNKISELSQK